MNQIRDLAREHGIHVIRCTLPIPTTINVYFVEGVVPTLIDVPPEGERYLDELEGGLNAIGSSMGKVGRIIVTHPHFDHYGSAQRIGEASGAQIWAFGPGAHCIERYEEELNREEAYRRALLVRCGVPATDVDYVTGYYREARRFGRAAKVSRYLAAGDTFDLGGAAFSVGHVPGHTPFCILLHDAASGLAFTGDFLPPDIPSNPLVQWADMESKAYRATGSYVRSLARARKMGLRAALPGHGPPITNPVSRIGGLLALIEGRKMAVLGVLRRDGLTPFQIALEVFPRSPRESLFRTVSDVMGQLEVLEDAGVVVRSGTEPILFRRAR